MAPPTHWPIEWDDFFVDFTHPIAFRMLDSGQEATCFQDGKHYNYPTIFFRTPLNKNRTNPK